MTYFSWRIGDFRLLAACLLATIPLQGAGQSHAPNSAAQSHFYLRFIELRRRDSALRRKAQLPTLSLAAWDYRVYAK